MISENKKNEIGRLQVDSTEDKASLVVPRVEDSLQVEELDENLYRCKPSILWRPIGSRGVFGGQIIGLALVAATRTVQEGFSVHSLHSYFLLGGDYTKSIIFHVTRVRDARSFCTRQVIAKQKGNAIFVVVCSFMKGEEPILVHQYKMPVAPDPESLPSREETLTKWLHQVPKAYQAVVQQSLEEPIPIDIRTCEELKPEHYIFPPKREPRQMVWMKSKTTLPNDPALHNCVAAYCSDHQLLWTTLRAHAITAWTNPSLKLVVSLDHSMWFHSEFRADEWLLYEMESPRTSGSRGVAFGRLWTREGKLAITCAQEGLLRAKVDPEKPLTSRTEDQSQVLYKDSKL